MKIWPSIGILQALYNMWLTKNVSFCSKTQTLIITRIIVGVTINTSSTKHKATYAHKSACKIVIYGMIFKIENSTQNLQIAWYIYRLGLVWNLGAKILQIEILREMMLPALLGVPGTISHLFSEGQNEKM